jgi:hypothetical protein
MKTTGARPRATATAASEWVGGSFPLTETVSDQGETFRPSMVIWYEIPDEVIVKGTLVPPGSESSALLETVAQAFVEPEVGPPRRPARLRVADVDTARRLRAETGLPVVVAAVPERFDFRALRRTLGV